MTMTSSRRVNKLAIIALAIGLLWGLTGISSVRAEHGKTTAQKIADRDFPSIFQAWNKVEFGPGVTGNEIHDTAMHDLYFTSTQGLGLQWDDGSPTNWDNDGLGTAFTQASISAATAKVQALHAQNPNLVILTEIRYWAAWDTYLPADHAWWKRGSDGSKIAAWQGEGLTIYYMDWNNEAFREQVANQAKAAVDTGLVDGIMIDCMAIDEFGDADADPNRVDLIARIRGKIGDKLLLVNSNQLKRPNMAPYINGLYMEVWQSSTSEHMQLVADTLKWAEEKVRSPKINALELWYDNTRDDLYKMRAATTLSLTHGNGYVLFADHNENVNPDHMHNWYDFWNANLGKPRAAGYQRADNELFQREFDNGTVIYNQKGNGTRTITFSEQRKRVSTGASGTVFQVNDNDGDIFLYTGAPPSQIPAPASVMISDYYAASASSAQGNHNWYTQYTDGSTYTNMSWDSANSKLFRFSDQGISVFGEFGGNGGRIDLGPSHDAVLKWVAPAAGSIQIGGSMRKEFGTDGDGVVVTVKKNNTVIWGPTVINSMTPTQLNLQQTVNAGDSIVFIANKNNNLTGDQLRLQPVVKLTPVTPQPGTAESMFASLSAPQAQGDWADKELGIVFSSSVSGKITHLKAYIASASEAGAHTATIWKNSDGTRIGGPYTLNFSSTIGWQTFDIADLNIAAGSAYTLSISTGSDTGRYYAMKTNSMSSGGSNGSHLSWQAHAGVYGTTLGQQPTTQAPYDANYMRDIVFIPD
ncbi:DUF4082 domain-containing protein [Paenibacillus sp. GCM10027626]|uniref:DUF4082 domain-containing protein n=1 Tax=Paenibacillus sp. GCM10027626 TaxID=3273411 RepID=UPI003640D5C0